MVTEYARDTSGSMDIECEIVQGGNVPQLVFYPKDIEELEVTANILMRREINDPKECSNVYPIVSLKKNSGIIKTQMLLNLIPANLCDADDVLEHAFPESTDYPISGASNIHLDVWKCRVPRNLLKDNLKAIREYDGYLSILDVHRDIVDFLKNFYEVPHDVSQSNTYDVRTMGMQRLVPEQQGSRLGSFCGAYIFLVTQFCLYNPLMKSKDFLRTDNTGMKRLLGHEFFFSPIFDSVSLVTENYLNHESYLLNISRQAARWVKGIDKTLKTGMPFFASETLSSLFSDEYMKDNRDQLFQSIYYKGRFYVICYTPEDFQRLKDVVRELKSDDCTYEFTSDEIKQILAMGLFFVDTPELKRLYRLELLRQGVADHLKLRVGGVSE